jgi:L-rhamnose isomerase/sugar isomerase
MLKHKTDKAALASLDELRIELPSWGFANTGTRFGKFMEPSAATCIEEKLADASFVHELTGSCPSVAVHVAWDFRNNGEDAASVSDKARELGISIGSINPTLFEEQHYKYGSLGNPDAGIREAAVQHIKDSIEIARKIKSRDIVLWFADGSNYPGTANIRRRKSWFEEGLKKCAAALSPGQRLLIEYKPFEPAFYHTDIADWGMSCLLARKCGSRARVLVDTGHHYNSQNIEQIVAWLLSEDMLGGFHFNDRKYGDDDLTLGSIDPYQMFRILNEIFGFAWDTGHFPDIGYMIDQSHNLKNKLEAAVQTIEMAQQLWVKAAVVDRSALAGYQDSCDLVKAEECLRSAFFTDVSPIIREWRRNRDLPENPLQALRESGYLERIAIERKERNQPSRSSYV